MDYREYNIGSLVGRRFNAFTDIIGRRVGNTTRGFRISQEQIKKHNGPFDSSVYTKYKKVSENIKMRRSVFLL